QPRRRSSDNAQFARACALLVDKEEASDIDRQQLWQSRICFGLHEEKLLESGSMIWCAREAGAPLPPSRCTASVVIRLLWKLNIFVPVGRKLFRSQPECLVSPARIRNVFGFMR